MQFLGKKIDKYFKEKSILFYVANTFTVYPNELLRDIYNNFGASDCLYINYVETDAWG